MEGIRLHACTHRRLTHAAACICMTRLRKGWAAAAAHRVAMRSKTRVDEEVQGNCPALQPTTSSHEGRTAQVAVNSFIKHGDKMIVFACFLFISTLIAAALLHRQRGSPQTPYPKGYYELRLSEALRDAYKHNAGQTIPLSAFRVFAAPASGPRGFTTMGADRSLLKEAQATAGDGGQRIWLMGGSTGGGCKLSGASMQ